jgi:geranylgeranyl pyrophosphate synthase
MNEYHKKALVILEKFPKNKYNDALKEMIHYVIERDY